MKAQIFSTIKGFALIEIILSIIIMALIFSGFVSFILQRKHDLNQTFTERALEEEQSKIIAHHFKFFVNYPSAQNPNFEKPYQNAVPFFPDNAQIIKGSNRDINGSDTILVKYHGNDNDDIFNCLGTPMKPNQTTDSLYYINNEGKLSCSIVENGVANLKIPNILIEDIEVMHIRYGEDLDNDGIANRFVPANFPELSFDRVVSVKISLLAKTGDIINPLLASKYYQLDDVEFGPYTDHFARRVLTFSLPVNVATKRTS